MADNGRIILNASLDNIARKVNIEENVHDAVEVIARSSDFADKTLFFMRDRPKSEFLEEVLDYQDLSRVGHYRMSRRKSRRRQIITFQKPEWGVEFYFNRTEPDVVAHLMGLIKQGRTYDNAEMTQVVLGAIGKKAPSEALLGSEARTLDAYVLDHVDVVKPSSIIIFGCQVPWFTQRMRQEVYQEKR
ncbi:MAG: hypothetical protein KJ600_01905 [Nanoarchaeota archaeon]|nr:hypothetical protein [Nanoarchaeota archaeon]MBU1103290.1 hypothetical protein [Nanoarchaeota archaeon]